MKKYITKITSSIAMIIGLMAVITGTRVLIGHFVPGYNVLPWLVYYNVSIGTLSIIAGLLIWKEHSYALRLSGLISVAHITVLSLLLIIFNLVVAPNSIKAMIFRSVIWVIIFIVVQRTRFTKPAK